MSEQRPTYTPSAVYRTIASYHLTLDGAVSVHSDNVLTVQASDALAAALEAIRFIRQSAPTRARVTNLVLVVTANASLDIEEPELV